MSATIVVKPWACGQGQALPRRITCHMINIRIDTTLGTIIAEIDTERAPITAANFLQYVDEGAFDGGAFWRTVRMDNQPDVEVKIEVVQAIVAPTFEKKLHPAIALERTRDTGLQHVDGTLSMSRFALDTAQAAFFICINDQPELDFGGKRYADGQGFAAFGRVIKGMDVVRQIQQSPCSTDGSAPTPEYAQVTYQRLMPPIGITKISRVMSHES